MYKKLNENFIDNYCDAFASKVTANFFKDEKNVITGKEILRVTPSKQVNFFVIKLLFRYWQEEIKKLESPFFNYKHDEVREAMIRFMNALSQHIEINRAKFEKLLNHAVKDTIYLVAMPQVYIEIDLDIRGVEIIEEKSIEGTIKYLKIYKNEIHSILSPMIGQTVDDLMDKLPNEFDDFETTGAIDIECELLTNVVQIRAEEIFFEDEESNVFDENELPEPGEEDLLYERPRSRKKFSNTLKGKREDIDMEDFIDEKKHKTKEVIYQSKNQEINRKMETPVILKKENITKDTINEQFEKKEKNIAERLETTNKEDSILSHISINHQYMFTKELFKNDKDEFARALIELEDYQCFDKSVEFLIQGYAKYNEWNMQSDEVKEFLKVLFRRYK